MSNEKINPEKFVINSEETLANIDKDITEIEAEIKMLDATFNAETEAILRLTPEAQKVRKITLKNQAEKIDARIEQLERELRDLRRLQMQIQYAVSVKKLWENIDNYLHASGGDKSFSETTPEAKQKKVEDIKAKYEELKNAENPAEDAKKVLDRFEKLVNSL